MFGYLDVIHGRNVLNTTIDSPIHNSELGTKIRHTLNTKS